jgi:hypothetical protein
VIAARGRHNPVTFEEFRVVSSLFLSKRTDRPASPAPGQEEYDDAEARSGKLLINVASDGGCVSEDGRSRMAGTTGARVRARPARRGTRSGRCVLPIAAALPVHVGSLGEPGSRGEPGPHGEPGSRVNRYELETPRITELTQVVVGEQRFTLANRIAPPGQARGHAPPRHALVRAYKLRILRLSRAELEAAR